MLFLLSAASVMEVVNMRSGVVARKLFLVCPVQSINFAATSHMSHAYLMGRWDLQLCRAFLLDTYIVVDHITILSKICFSQATQFITQQQQCRSRYSRVRRLAADRTSQPNPCTEGCSHSGQEGLQNCGLAWELGAQPPLHSVEWQADVVGGEVDVGGVRQVGGEVADGVSVGGGVLGGKAQVGLHGTLMFRNTACQISSA